MSNFKQNRYNNENNKNYGTKFGYRKNNYNNNRYNNNRYIPPVQNKLEQENNIDNNLDNNLDLKLLETFEELNIKENLLRGIYSYGFETPSKIQSYAIPYMIKRKDIIAQSQSGTGKTGAFTIGLLSIIDETKLYPQAIVLCNTHELATQIQTVIQELGKYLGVKTGLLIGGVPMTKNIEDIKSCQVLVGTPGRIKKMLELNYINIDLLKILVIDEADELLKQEFLDQTKYIIQNMIEGIQICIFSATMPYETLKLTTNFMQNPVRILVKRENLSLELIKQYYIDVMQDNYKLETLEDLYSKLSINQCIIYVNSINRAEILKKQLLEHKHAVQVIHSKLDNVTRMDLMAQFRRGEFRVLISTDLICRGIDIQHINYVINYDIPYNVESYLHRIGRSGRYGKTGIAINFVTKKDYYYMRNIEKHYKINIEIMPDLDVVNSIN